MLIINLIIATYNGEKRIRKTLESLFEMQEHMSLSQNDWTIIISNNNSNDGTLQILNQFIGRLPIKVIDAPIPGKSMALNEALKYIDSLLVAFTDDDVNVSRDWLLKLIECANQNPDYDVFGGRISGRWEKELDQDLLSWFPIGSTYALHAEKIENKFAPDIIWGPNMMFRRKIFDLGYKFNELIGPSPDKWSTPIIESRV